jgi:hypothetical protein
MSKLPLVLAALAALSPLRASAAEPTSLWMEATITDLEGKVLASAGCATTIGKPCEAEDVRDEGAGTLARLAPVSFEGDDGRDVAVDVNLVIRERAAEGKCPGTFDVSGLCGTTLKAMIATKAHYGGMGWTRIAEAKGPYVLTVEVQGLDVATAHKGAEPSWKPIAKTAPEP